MARGKETGCPRIAKYFVRSITDDPQEIQYGNVYAVCGIHKRAKEFYFPIPPNIIDCYWDNHLQSISEAEFNMRRALK